MAHGILKPLFPLGAVYLAAGVSALGLDPYAIARMPHRHQCGDRGDLDEEDKAANDSDQGPGGRLLGLYGIEAGALYLITGHGRPVTTVMLRDEY